MKSKNYIEQLEQENSYLKNIVSSSNSEKELENDFIRIAQALESNIGEELGGEPSVVNQTEEVAKKDMGAPLEDESSDEIEDILSSPDEQPAEVVEWDNFSIVKSDEYSNKLQQEQGLSVQDADTKSFYIRFKTPDELLAIQGQIFGINKDKGEGLKNVGGFNTKEELGKDLEYMKNLWETGFPTKEKDNLLITIDELSPSLEVFQDAKEKEQILQPKEKEIVNVEKEEPTEEPLEETENLEDLLKEVPEETKSEKVETEKTKPETSKKSAPAPRPIGKANKKELRIIKRAERIKELRNI